MFYSTRYFAGEERIDSYSKILANGVLNCDIYERWQPIHVSTMSCGRKERISITKTIGICIEEFVHFESSIGSSIGIKALVELTAEFSTSRGVTLKKENNQTTTFETEITADSCGRKTIEIFQKVREYRFTLNRFLTYSQRDTRPVTAKVSEYLRCFNDRTERIAIIPDCSCGESAAKTYVEVSANIAPGYFVTYTTEISKSLEAKLWNHSVFLDEEGRPLSSSIDIRSGIPDYTDFLLEGKVYAEIRVYYAKFFELPLLLPHESRPMVAVSPELIRGASDVAQGYKTMYLSGFEIGPPVYELDILSDKTENRPSTRLNYHNFSLLIDPEIRMARWSAANAILNPEKKPLLKVNINNLKLDYRIPVSWQYSRDDISYFAGKFDFIQLAAEEEIANWSDSGRMIARKNSFCLANFSFVPKMYQWPVDTVVINNNIWPQLDVRFAGRLACIFAGPITKEYRTPSLQLRSIPQEFWRVVVTTTDNGKLVSFGFLIQVKENPYDDALTNPNEPFVAYAVGIETISAKTGIKFDKQVYDVDVLRNNPSWQLVPLPIG